MVEKKVRKKEDVLELIIEVIGAVKKSKKITKTQIEKECGMGIGTISKWENSSPSIDNMIKVLDFLNVEITLRTDEMENVLSNESTNETMEKSNNIEESDIDTLIVILMMKILKSDITLSDKERLYKVLQAFI